MEPAIEFVWEKLIARYGMNPKDEANLYNQGGAVAANFGTANQLFQTIDNVMKIEDYPALMHVSGDAEVFRTIEGPMPHEAFWAYFSNENFAYGGLNHRQPMQIFKNSTFQSGRCYLNAFVALSSMVLKENSVQFGQSLMEISNELGDYPTFALFSAACFALVAQFPELLTAKIPNIGFNPSEPMLHVADRRGLPIHWGILQVGSLLDVVNARMKYSYAPFMEYPVGAIPTNTAMRYTNWRPQHEFLATSTWMHMKLAVKGIVALCHPRKLLKSEFDEAMQNLRDSLRNALINQHKRFPQQIDSGDVYLLLPDVEVIKLHKEMESINFSRMHSSSDDDFKELGNRLAQKWWSYIETSADNIYNQSRFERRFKLVWAFQYHNAAVQARLAHDFEVSIKNLAGGSPGQLHRHMYDWGADAWWLRAEEVETQNVTPSETIVTPQESESIQEGATQAIPSIVEVQLAPRSFVREAVVGTITAVLSTLMLLALRFGYRRYRNKKFRSPWDLSKSDDESDDNDDSPGGLPTMPYPTSFPRDTDINSDVSLTKSEEELARELIHDNNFCDIDLNGDRIGVTLSVIAVDSHDDTANIFAEYFKALVTAYRVFKETGRVSSQDIARLMLAESTLRAAGYPFANQAPSEVLRGFNNSTFRERTRALWGVAAGSIDETFIKLLHEILETCNLNDTSWHANEVDLSLIRLLKQLTALLDGFSNKNLEDRVRLLASINTVVMAIASIYGRGSDVLYLTALRQAVYTEERLSHVSSDIQTEEGRSEEAELIKRRIDAEINNIESQTRANNEIAQAQRAVVEATAASTLRGHILEPINTTAQVALTYAMLRRGSGIGLVGQNLPGASSSTALTQPSFPGRGQRLGGRGWKMPFRRA